VNTTSALKHIALSSRRIAWRNYKQMKTLWGSWHLTDEDFVKILGLTTSRSWAWIGGAWGTGRKKLLKTGVSAHEKVGDAENYARGDAQPGPGAVIWRSF
jgi:hypothetical protein